MEDHIVNHPGHNHLLRELGRGTVFLDGGRACSVCNRVLGYHQNVFYCPEEGCEYFLHSWCAYWGCKDDYYSDQIDHPLHPQHPLTLSLYYYFCKQTRTSGLLLHCAPCDFYLDFFCAREFEDKKQLLSQYEVQHFFHKKHALLPHRHSFYSFSSSGYERYHYFSSPSGSHFCGACGIGIYDGEHVLKCSGRGCEDYYLHVGCFRVPEEMKHPLHPQHTLTLVPRSIIQVGDEDKGEALTSKTYYHPSFKNRIQGGEEDTYYHPSFKHRIQGGDEEEEQKLRCGACNNLIKRNAFALNCNQCSRGGFAFDMRCAFLNPTVKYDRHDQHLLAHYNHIDVQDALCAACNKRCLWNLYRRFACNFNIHKACLSC
ncbi:uncharacterized protein LOC132800235 [Ziziphus jujuba]|uniref:Uncharacterized protein LOC132800235 n=1 Tax=Ziziphus jujuba TaxID=326968 RepID=A0ABM3ZYC4_ZIZJJ|nr:uncharacterized protein LOC132800235 [Ziziphus jujuba]